MPYVPESERSPYLRPTTPGRLNWAITRLITRYLQLKGVSYASLNECVGVLECAKMELYRRMAAPYEDAKCEQNGDVYP